MTQDQILEQQHAESAELLKQMELQNQLQLQYLEQECSKKEEAEQLNALANDHAGTFTEVFIQADKEQLATQIVDAVEAGFIDPLKALAAVKAMEKIVDILTNKDPKKNKLADKAMLLQSYITDAADKQPEKQFGMYGATFKKTEVGVKYDFSQTGDSKLQELEAAAKAATDALKARQDFLKTVPCTGLIVTDETTGETYTVYPPAKSSTSTVSVSWK